MTISSVITYDKWIELIEDIIVHPSWENEVILARLAQVCSLFRNIINGKPTVYRRLLGNTEMRVHSVLSSDVLFPYFIGAELFRRHAALIYSAESDRSIKIVDLKTGNVSLIPENNLYMRDIGRQFFSVKGTDADFVYQSDGSRLSYIHLPTHSTTPLNRRDAERCIYHQARDGTLVQGHRYLDRSFKIFKDGREIAEIPQLEDITGIPEIELCDLQLHHGLLCALYVYPGEPHFETQGRFVLYDIEGKCECFQSHVFPFLRAGTRSEINTERPFTFSQEMKGFIEHSSRLYFNGECILLITNEPDRSFVWLIEKEAGFIQLNSSSLHEIELPNTDRYTLSLSGRRFALLHHMRREIEIFEAKKSANNTATCVISRLNVLKDIPTDDHTKMAFKEDMIAVTCENEIKLYAMTSSCPIACFTAKANIKKLQFDLDEDLPQVTAALITDEVQSWIPKDSGGIPPPSCWESLASVLKVILRFFEFLWAWLCNLLAN